MLTGQRDGTQDARPRCLETFITEVSEPVTAWASVDRVLGLGPSTAVSVTTTQGTVTKDVDADASFQAQSPAVSLEAAGLHRLQILLVELFLGFKEFPQLLGSPFAQLFAFRVMCGQTLRAGRAQGQQGAPDPPQSPRAQPWDTAGRGLTTRSALARPRGR